MDETACQHERRYSCGAFSLQRFCTTVKAYIGPLSCGPSWDRPDGCLRVMGRMSLNSKVQILIPVPVLIFTTICPFDFHGAMHTIKQ